MSESSPEPLLVIDKLQISFRVGGTIKPAVRGLSFTVAAGEVVALVGESGSGKSVTAQSVMRLLPAPPALYPGGGIRWRGEDVLTMGADRLHRLRGGEVGMVFQEPMTALNPTMTCGAQVAEALDLHTSLRGSERQQRVLDVFTQVGIPQAATRAGQYPHELSGGLRQRVCIAIALACNPILLIADEPTTALDVTIQAQILDLLKRLQRERGMAVLFITHDLGVVRELCDRVVIMRHGEKLEEGPVAQVFAAPAHPYTRALIACRPRIGDDRQRLPTVDEQLANAATAISA